MWEVRHEGQIYNIETKIGEGYTAEVYKATSKQKTICVKVINDDFLSHSMGRNLVENQVKILSSLEHKNVLKFIKKEHQQKLMIVTEYCEGGNLFEYLRSKGRLEPSETSAIMKQLIEGCQYIHGKGFIHRDLKPENVFLTDKTGKHIKIADFGFAVRQDSKLISANVGSPLYMPYQALASKTFSVKSDIFALGVIWYELLTGKAPFSASTEKQLKEMTKNDQFRQLELSCSSKQKELILKCLKSRASERPALTDLLAGIEEVGSGHKGRSKSFFYLSSLDRSSVTRKQSKQNKHPVFSHQAVNQKNRSKTILEIKQGKTEPLSKMLQIQLPKKILGQNNSKSVSQSSVLSRSNLIILIKKLFGVKMSFLPISIQQKFKIMLNLYERLISGKEMLKAKGEQVRQDELISSLTSCKTEQDFCISSFGFIRRLIRLAKAYKEIDKVIEDLSTLWSHVQAQCLIK